MSGSVNLNRFPTALRVAIKEALESGWTFKKGGSGGLKMRSPKGTQWMHISPGSNIPDEVVKNLRTKMNRALIEEADDDIVAAAEDPKEYRVTTTCTICFTEFLSLDGFAAHQEACHKRAAEALEAEQEASKAITQTDQDEPSQGRTEVPAEVTEDPIKSSGSGKMSNKEEDNMGGSKPGVKRGPYNRREAVKPGIARAIYEAMRQRSQHRDEALSTYANIIGAMVEEKVGALSDSEAKLAAIYEVLELDPSANDRADEMAAKVEQLEGDLKAIKDLLSGIN